jgi:hypothetical protein
MAPSKLLAARADVPRAPVRSGLGEIRGLTYLEAGVARDLRWVSRNPVRLRWSQQLILDAIEQAQFILAYYVEAETP